MNLSLIIFPLQTWGRQHSLDIPGVVEFPDYLRMQDALIEVRIATLAVLSSHPQGYGRYNSTLHQARHSVAIAPVGHAMRVVHSDASAVTPFGAHSHPAVLWPSLQ